jgi:hypothetical protein
VNKSTAAAAMDMAEVAWRVGDTDLALQLLEEGHDAAGSSSIRPSQQLSKT